jgi:AcrR family transcriptional regulator
MVQIESSPDSAKAVERRREIVQAAGEVFRRRGVDHAGMREIAAACGMQVGNLYYWFENKASLVAFCQRDSLDGLLATAAWVRGLALAPDTQLLLLLVAHVRRLNEWSPGSLAHLEAEGLDGAARTELLAARDRYARELEVVVDAGIRDGVFRAVDPRVAVLGALGATNWTVRWLRPTGPRSAHSLGLELAEMIVRGLLVEGRHLALPDENTYATLERVALELR